MPDLSLETSFDGYVIGIDEAGRGPWAGPVTITALWLNPDFYGELPNDINAMSNLQFIDARNNKLKKLPTKIGHLRNLKDLYVAGNSICSNMNNEEIMIAYDLPNGINKLALCTKQCATTCLNKHLSDNICDDPSIVSFFRAVDPAFRYAFTSSLSIRPNKTGHRQYNYASGRVVT